MKSENSAESVCTCSCTCMRFHPHVLTTQCTEISFMEILAYLDVSRGLRVSTEISPKGFRDPSLHYISACGCIRECDVYVPTQHRA